MQIYGNNVVDMMSWDSLSNLLNETTSTLNLSKELNKILLEELKRSETDLLRHLAKKKEVERIGSNATVKSKSFAIQTEDQDNEKDTVRTIDDFPNGKPTKIRNALHEIPPLILA